MMANRVFDKRKMIFIELLGAVLLAVSCNSTKEVTVRHLQPSRTIDSFGQEIYISDGIRSMIEEDGCIYFMDNKLGGVIKTDTDLNPLTVFGRKGRGPGETVFAETFGVSDNALYLNGNNDDFHVFSKDSAKYLKTIRYGLEVGSQTLTRRLIIGDSDIIASYRGNYTSSGTPVVGIDTSGQVTGAFKGTVIGENDDIKALTERDIFKTETGYAAVVKMAPVIDLYDENLNLMSSTDISYIPVIERKAKDIEKSREASAPGTVTVYYQFGDSYYSDGKLYILCLTVNEDPADNMRNLCNTIVVLDVDGDTCRYAGQLILPDKYYWCICVTSDGRLIASNAMQSQIEVFDL